MADKLSQLVRDIQDVHQRIGKALERIGEAIGQLDSFVPDPETTPAPTVEQRAGEFGQWYEDTHQQLFQLAYIGTHNDYQAAIELCRKLTDEEVRDAALVWFGMEDDFATRGTRTVPKFASRATYCLQLAKRVAV